MGGTTHDGGPVAGYLLDSIMNPRKNRRLSFSYAALWHDDRRSASRKADIPAREHGRHSDGERVRNVEVRAAGARTVSVSGSIENPGDARKTLLPPEKPPWRIVCRGIQVLADVARPRTRRRIAN